MSFDSATEVPAEIAMALAEEMARAERMFAANVTMRKIARHFAATHPYAIQYLEQAPVLAFAAMMGANTFDTKAAAMVRLKLRPLCEVGAPLKVVMREFGLPQPMRRLSAAAILPSSILAMRSLAHMHPSVLGNIIPARSHQRWWLARLELWRRAMTRWAGSFASPREIDACFGWAAAALAAEAKRKPRAVVNPTEVLDLYVLGERFGDCPPFNHAWKWPRAAEEASAWHARRAALALLPGGLKLDDRICQGSNPDRLEIRGYEFIALRTARDLANEGAAMRHCVASYVHPVRAGSSVIVSMRAKGRRVATIELSGSYWPVQVKGPANAPVGGAAVVSAIVDYCEQMKTTCPPIKRNVRDPRALQRRPGEFARMAAHVLAGDYQINDVDFGVPAVDGLRLDRDQFRRINEAFRLGGARVVVPVGQQFPIISTTDFRVEISTPIPTVTIDRDQWEIVELPEDLPRGEPG